MIFGRLFSKAKKTKASATAVEGFAELVTAHDTFAPPPARSRDMTALFNSSPRLRSIAGKVSRAVAKQPWHFEKGEGRSAKRITEHDALAFLRRGNAKLRGRKSIAATVAYLDINGEAFWVVGRDASGRPSQYAVIPPYWVQDVPDDLDGGVFRIAVHGARPYDIPARDVVMFREPDLLDPYVRGSSFALAASLEIDTDKAAATFLNSFFKNSARPDYILTGTKEAPIGRADKPRFETYIDERHRGAAKHGRPLVFTSEVKIHELGKGLRENEMTALRDQLGGVIMQLWGVPPEIFGKLESSNRATIDSADYLFAKHTLVPRLDDLQEVLEAFFEREWSTESRGLRLVYETPVAEDVAHALEVAKAFSGDMTRNEKRALAKLPPVDGGDEMPDAANATQESGGNTTQEAARGPANSGKKAVDDPAPHALCGGAMKCELTSPAPPETKAAPAVFKALSPEDIVYVSAAHADPMVAAQATAIMEEVFRSLLTTYGEELLAELEASANFAVNGEVALWLQERGSRLIGQINDTTAKELRASLVEGVAANEAVEELAARVNDVFAAASKTRAAMIGRTEATAVTGFGSLVAAKQGGFGEKEWMSSEDQVVRDSHEKLDGTRVATELPFTTADGLAAMHPGGFGVAKEDAECRCAMRPVLPAEKTLKTAGDFRAFQREKWEIAAAYIEKKARAIFDAQKEVALVQLQRATA